MYSQITKHANGILLWTMNHQQSKNALGYKMLDDLHQCLQQPCTSFIVNSILPDVFCSGGNLKERLLMDKKQTIAFTDKLREIYNQIDCLQIPTFAALHGKVLGGGFEFSLSFDFRYSHSNTILALPQVSIGSIPGLGGITRLPVLIGEAKAKELILLGKELNAQEAMAMGLITGVSEDPLSMCMQMAEKCVSRLESYKIAKKAILGANERECYIEAMDNAERMKALKRFANKINPKDGVN